MKKVLVTGGLGFIGSHTAVELLSLNYEVLIIDNLSNSRIDVLDGINKICGIKPKFVDIDLSKKQHVLDFFKKNTDLTGIIHFAAYKAVGESVKEPLKYYENNIFSLVNILKAVDHFKMKVNFIFSSSCTVYGQAKYLPIDEDTEIAKAHSPYGNTKQICEEILMDFSKIYKQINVISLRYFNPIGAHPSIEIGELPLGTPQNLVPFMTQTGAGVREVLTVFGNNYNTKDGTCVRDYIDVVDLSKAHVAALKNLEESKNPSHYENYNLGTGKGSSVLDVIKSFEKISGEKLNYKIGQKRSGDVESIYADTRKALNILGWKAEVSLDESIKNAWLWEKKIRK